MKSGCVVSSTLDVVVMKGYACVIESHTVLQAILSADVLAVLLAGTAAGATLVVDDGGGADRMGMQTVEAVA